MAIKQINCTVHNEIYCKTSGIGKYQYCPKCKQQFIEGYY